jgi:hypothetical protein
MRRGWARVLHACSGELLGIDLIGAAVVVARRRQQVQAVSIAHVGVGVVLEESRLEIEGRLRQASSSWHREATVTTADSKRSSRDLEWHSSWSKTCVRIEPTNTSNLVSNEDVHMWREARDAVTRKWPSVGRRDETVVGLLIIIVF